MAAHRALPSLGFSNQVEWSGLPFPSPMYESEKWKGSHSVVSSPQQPHGLQPSRLLHPSDFLGKSTGVRCHWTALCKCDVTDIGYHFVHLKSHYLWGFLFVCLFLVMMVSFLFLSFSFWICFTLVLRIRMSDICSYEISLSQVYFSLISVFLKM